MFGLHLITLNKINITANKEVLKPKGLKMEMEAF